MSLEGDWARLRQLISELKGVPGVMKDMTFTAGAGVDEQYKADFAASRDPWGDPWPALKAGGGKPLLGASEALSTTFPSTGRLVVRMKPPKYWVYHQVGANNMHQRAVLPFSASKWDAPIQAKLAERVMSHFKSRG